MSAGQVPERLCTDAEWLGRFVQLSRLHEVVSRINNLFTDADQPSIKVRSTDVLALQSINRNICSLHISQVLINKPMQQAEMMAHVGKEGNDLADSEAKHGSTLPQPASLDYIMAFATLVTNQHAIAATRYDSDPHMRVHRVFTDMEHPHCCWPCDWTRDQCITVAQLRTGHSPLLAAYLHHCNGADETAEHLVLHCPAASTLPGAAGVMANSPLSK